MSNSNDETKKLSDMFDEGLDAFNSISNTEEPTNSSGIQVRIRKTMALLEDATRLVSLIDMFSPNETIEDVATENIKYFLLPALLGTLSLKMCVEDRLEVVNTAEVYFMDFLQRCNAYGITNLRIPEKGEAEDSPSQPQQQSLVAMVETRNSKIRRYTEKKELEEQLKILRKSDTFATDEDTKRKYFLAMVKSFALDAIDELDSIKKEKPLVEYMSNLKKEGRSEPEKPKRYPHKPLKPIIITRDEMQKKVFGTGYPSIPTMTLEEFYEKRVQDGDFPNPLAMRSRTLQDVASAEATPELRAEQEAEEKEERIESDDPEELRRAREFDEFKDEHRRGEGNRMNRS
ncbi:immunoglobulin-binding protein 1 [Bacillus rossius redtenbacheri]|uniref:immunoglobulin-binding protein 1 n=1 Tax=Bacillus rossius redtenbacheri TaxID=93214 RepID=UPI002FDCE4E4